MFSFIRNLIPRVQAAAYSYFVVEYTTGQGVKVRFVKGYVNGAEPNFDQDERIVAGPFAEAVTATEYI